MTESGLRTAVVVPVPEAASAVDEWRERTCADKPSLGVPAHVTILFPFVPAGHVDPELVSSLSALTEAVRPFRFELRELRRFPDTLYLAPEPPEPFVRLTAAVVAGFPDYPPYEGAFDTIIPHLTIARGDDVVLDQASAFVRPLLPIRATASEAVLLEEVAPNWGRWEELARLPFGG